MSSVEIRILDRTPFIDRSKPDVPVNKIQVTFQMPDGRIGTTSILPKEINTDAENKAIAAAIKAMPASSLETRNIKL